MRNSTWTVLFMALAMLIGATGCSDDDETLPTAPVDTAPPMLPSGLDVEVDAATCQVTITWKPNTTDADLAGYLIARTVQGVTMQLVDEPQLATQYVDNLGSIGRAATYRLTAIDEAGNASAAAILNVEIPDELQYIAQ